MNTRIGAWSMTLMAVATAPTLSHADVLECGAISTGAHHNSSGRISNFGQAVIGLAVDPRTLVLHAGVVPCLATGEFGGALIGDMNCDGFVTVSDIGPFVLALTNPAGYAAAFPACDIMAGDVNQDGFVTVSDIGPFVALLAGG